MRTSIMTFLITLITSIGCNAGVDNLFTYENEKFYGINLNYRMAVVNPQLPIPETIVIYLHGGSAQGSDNEAQLEGQAVQDIYNYLKDNGFHARILAPQAPEGQQWEGIMLPTLKSLSDKYRVTDLQDSYILGGSMGGYGVWNMLAAYPAYFKGAMPVACNTPKAPAENYAGTRILSVVGGEDSNRNISAIKTFFTRLEGCTAAGAKLDVEDEWNHRETCEWSFTPERLKWLFNTGESSVDKISLGDSSDLSLNSNGNLYDLSGNRIIKPSSGNIYISISNNATSRKIIF